MQKNCNNFQHFKVHAAQSFTKSIFQEEEDINVEADIFFSSRMHEDSQPTSIPLKFIYDLSYTGIMGMHNYIIVQCGSVFSRVILLLIPLPQTVTLIT